MLTRRIIKLTIMTIAMFGAVAGFSTGAVASTSASGQPTTVTAPAIANFPPTSNRCVNQTHTIPCWALTIHSGTFYLRDGTTESIGGNDLVLIQCYYSDSSGVIQDHVEAEDAGRDPEVGHIPDSNIDLNNHNPWHLQSPPNIGTC